MRKTPAQKEIDRLYDQTVNAALAEVERIARKILVEHPVLDEFIMGMGTWSFTSRRDKGMSWTYPDKTYMKPMDDFICEWDEYLRLTGTPMRFTATGKVKTEW